MKAVILAGGLGSRLEPFTKIIPKPLLPLGESSVLEIQIFSLKKYGFKEIYIATNYMADYVQSFLGGGKKFGVKITFSREKKPLGTCGPVLLLREYLTEPFLLINGDILTTLNFKKIYQFALKTRANLVVVTKELVIPFDFGNIESKGNYITNIREKPKFTWEILAGIYVLKPPIFDLIPKNKYFGIDSLILKMLKAKMKVAKYKMRDYWLDIGRLEDYQVARDDYKKHFSQLKRRSFALQNGK